MGTRRPCDARSTAAMPLRRVPALLVAAALAWSVPAAAAVQQITCDGKTPGQLAALLGTVRFGDTVVITGICVGDITLPTTLTLTNHLSSAALVATDGIEGQVTVATLAGGATINGILLEGHPTSTGAIANLAVFGPGQTTLQHSKVTRAQADGIYIGNGGSVYLVGSVVSGNGVARMAGNSDGVDIDVGGFLDDAKTGPASTITGNPGRGILVENGGSLRLHATTVSADGVSEIVAMGGTVRLEGTVVKGATGAAQPAVQVFNGSRLELYGAGVSGPGGAVLVAGGSSALAAGATLSGSGAAAPALEVASASSLMLGGGNRILNAATGGVAAKVDRNANLMQVLSSRFGAADAVDTVTGAGVVLEESSIDLGTGLIGGAPSLTWTGSLTVSERSVVKLQGGVAVSGSLQLTDGADGLFYLANGGTNRVSGGVTCPTGGPPPNSHVANPTDVTPNVKIGTTTPDCLND